MSSPVLTHPPPTCDSLLSATEAQRTAWLNFQPALAFVRDNALAETSTDNFGTAARAYIAVCSHFGLQPVPATGITDRHLCAFITFLVMKKYAFATVTNYLSMGPRLLSLRVLGTYTSIENRPLVQQALNGARRLLGTAPKAKLPITLPLLTAMLGTLDQSVRSKLLRAAMLVGFWASLRKSNISLKGGRAIGHCLTRGNVVFREDGRVSITLTSAKNNQFRARTHTVVLPRFGLGDPAGHLCPSRALEVFYADPAASNLPFNGPAFSYRQSQQWVSLTHSQLVNFIKTSLRQLNVDANAYSGHSLRRGGITTAFRSGASEVELRYLGDFHSAVFQRYITLGAEDASITAQRMAAYANYALM